MARRGVAWRGAGDVRYCYALYSSTGIPISPAAGAGSDAGGGREAGVDTSDGMVIPMRRRIEAGLWCTWSGVEYEGVGAQRAAARLRY